MLRRSAISVAISGVYLDGRPVFFGGAFVALGVSTPWLVVVLALAGRLGGLAVVSGMVNPYSYALQCNWLRGLESHQRSSGYEPDGLLLSYPATKVVGGYSPISSRGGASLALGTHSGVVTFTNTAGDYSKQ